jgi:hypothetical protein
MTRKVLLNYKGNFSTNAGFSFSLSLAHTHKYTSTHSNTLISSVQFATVSARHAWKREVYLIYGSRIRTSTKLFAQHALVCGGESEDVRTVLCSIDIRVRGRTVICWIDIRRVLHNPLSWNWNYFDFIFWELLLVSRHTCTYNHRLRRCLTCVMWKSGFHNKISAKHTQGPF